MLARQVVLSTLPNFSHPRPLLSRQQSVGLSPLHATLMGLPASVANKRLTENLTPLDATLTKNTGVTSFQPKAFPSSRPASQTFRPSGDSSPRVFSLTPPETLLCERHICNSLVFFTLQALPSYVSHKSFACHSYENCRVYTKDSHSGTLPPPIHPGCSFDLATFRHGDVRTLPIPLYPTAQTTPPFLVYTVPVLSSPLCVRGIALFLLRWRSS
jgi:hypothetical protein